MSNDTRQQARAKARLAYYALAACVALVAPTGMVSAAQRIERLGLGSEDPYLRGTLAERQTEIIIPTDAVVSRAQLALSYSNALAVLPDDSQLRIVLNGEALAELPLTAVQGAIAAQLDLPPDLLHPGRNRLSLVAQQRHRLACSRAGFEELWTRIELDRSELTLAMALPDGPPTLEQAADRLSRPIHDAVPLTVSGVREAWDPEIVAWGGDIVQALALRRRAGINDVVAGRLTKPLDQVVGGNIIVVGTLSELRPFVSGLDATRAPAGLVEVRQLPSDADHLALIVSGDDDAAVGAAARRLADRPFGWPSVAAATPDMFATAPQADRELSRTLRTGGTWLLRELDYTTRDVPLGYLGREATTFELPADIFAGNGQRMVLRLNYAYGPGLAPESALLVLVNGAPWNMVRLDDVRGRVVDGQRVELPMGLFRAGLNRIEFEPVLYPGASADCGSGPGSPMFTLFDDSTLALPEFAKLALAPDLATLAAAGLPFTSEPPRRSGLTLTTLAEPTVSAVWTLQAKLAQRAGRPLPRFEPVAVGSSFDGDLLVAGAMGDLPPTLAQHLPAGTGGWARVPQGLPETALPGLPATGSDPRDRWRERLAGGYAGSGSVLDGVLLRLVGSAAARNMDAGASRPPATEVEQAGSPVGTAAWLVAYRSGLAAETVTTLLTAPSAEALARATAELVTDDLWNRIAGDTVEWQPDGTGLVSERRQPAWTLGALPQGPTQLMLAGQTFLSRTPSCWLLVVLGAVLAAGTALPLALRRLQATRQ